MSYFSPILTLWSNIPNLSISSWWHFLYDFSLLIFTLTKKHIHHRRKASLLLSLSTSESTPLWNPRRKNVSVARQEKHPVFQRRLPFSYWLCSFQINMKNKFLNSVKYRLAYIFIYKGTLLILVNMFHILLNIFPIKITQIHVFPMHQIFFIHKIQY